MPLSKMAFSSQILEQAVRERGADGGGTLLV